MLIIALNYWEVLVFYHYLQYYFSLIISHLLCQAEVVAVDWAEWLMVYLYLSNYYFFMENFLGFHFLKTFYEDLTLFYHLLTFLYFKEMNFYAPSLLPHFYYQNIPSKNENSLINPSRSASTTSKATRRSLSWGIKSTNERAYLTFCVNYGRFMMRFWPLW